MTTIPVILNALEPYTGRFPIKLVEEAIRQREAITPELLRVVETVANSPVEFAKRKEYKVHLVALFLLAQFRETRAYLPIVRMFSGPGETPFDLAGDAVTETLYRIIASVYDNNPAPLRSLVQNESVNPFVRVAATRAFLVLERTEQMTRADVVEYFRSLFENKLPRTRSYAWTGLAFTVAELPAPELLADVRRAYANGLMDDTVADVATCVSDLAAGISRRQGRYDFITDAIEELEGWVRFEAENS